MDYENLKFQEKFIGKVLTRGSKSYTLSNDLPARDKKFIFNMICNSVFDIFSNIQKPEIIYMSDFVNKEEVLQVTSDKNIEELSLKELRVLYPNIKAASKAKFLEQI